MTKLNGRKLFDFQKRMLAWYARHKRAMPWRGTRDAYRVWVSEIMLQQTRVAAVLPYYRRFVRRFPTVQALARARSEEVLKLWAGLGYYSRARNLHAAAKKIVAKHGGKFPREHEAALALPGVGRYTAAAVLSIAYGEPLAVLDGNVARVLARLGGVRGDLRAAGRWNALAKAAQSMMPGAEGAASSAPANENAPAGCQRYEGAASSAPANENAPAGCQRYEGAASSAPTKRNSKFENRNSKTEKQERNYRSRRDAGATQPGEWNQAMMELGATVCTPRTPRCGECPVARWCKAYEMGIAEQVPAARKKRAAQKIEIAAAVMVDPRGRTLLVKPERAETNGLFSRMWQFPAVEVRDDAFGELRKYLEETGVASGKKEEEMRKRGNEERERAETNGAWVELGAVKHSVTYREVTLRPFLARVKELPKVEGGRVTRLAQLEKAAVSSATRKIARAAIWASLEKTGRKGAARR